MMSKFSEKALISQKFNNPEEEKKNSPKCGQLIYNPAQTWTHYKRQASFCQPWVNDPIGFPNWLSTSSSIQTLFQKMPIDNYMYEVQYMHF